MIGAGILFVAVGEAPSRRYVVLGVSISGEGVELSGGGGGDDSDADLKWTAVREATKELGLKPVFVKIIAEHIELHDHHIVLDKYGYTICVVKNISI